MDIYRKNLMNCKEGKGNILVLEKEDMRLLQSRPCSLRKLKDDSKNEKWKCWYAREGDWVIHLVNSNMWQLRGSIQTVRSVASL